MEFHRPSIEIGIVLYPEGGCHGVLALEIAEAGRAVYAENLVRSIILGPILWELR